MSETLVLGFLLEQLDRFGCESFLDVGCGDGKYLQRIRNIKPELTAYAVDAHKPSLRKVAAAQKWNATLPYGLSQLGDMKFDAVFCLDVIEHLPKKESETLVQMLSALARKVAIVFTPQGFMFQEPLPGNPWMEHKCGWEKAELEKFGFQTVVWERFNYGMYHGHERIANGLWGVFEK